MGNINIFITSEADIKKAEQFEEELHHIKCGLLYGDNTTVLSVSSFALLALHRMYLVVRNTRLPLNKRIKELNRLAEAMGTETLKVDEVKKLSKSKFEELAVPFTNFMREKLSDYGWLGIAEATKASDLRFISPHKGKDPYNYLEQLLKEGKEGKFDISPVLYWVRAREILEKASCYPLLSDTICKLMRQEISMGLMDVKRETIATSKIAGFSSYMFVELPSFDGATVPQIIQLRRYLERHLKKFRKATVHYSQSIEKAQWDKDFIIDARRAFDEDVLPALKQLKEIIKTDSAIRQFGSQLKKASKGSFFSLLIGVGNAVMFEDVALGLASTASGLILDGAQSAIRERVGKHREIQRNGLYFYHKAGELLLP